MCVRSRQPITESRADESNLADGGESIKKSGRLGVRFLIVVN